MSFTNPITPGFAPDPSVVLVKDTFFLVNSSFHVFPGLPIYTSKDLQNWTLTTHAISSPSQLDLSKAFTKFIPLPSGLPLVITGGLFPQPSGITRRRSTSSAPMPTKQVIRLGILSRTS
ncbi:glycosyl hydrolase [Xylariales sp. PMI_506]|nr:glycosyl hydrolase [Xylariales sp. PMI_506]